MNNIKKTLSNQIKNILNNARKTVIQTVNTTMVYTYYEIGRLIIENEQQGQTRAKYGKKVLQQVSKELLNEFGKGFSVQNLERMRLFYSIYSKSSTLSRISSQSEKAELVYARKFYMNEVLQN